MVHTETAADVENKRTVIREKAEGDKLEIEDTIFCASLQWSWLRT